MSKALHRWRPSPIADPELDLAVKTIYERVDNLGLSSPQAPTKLTGSAITNGIAKVPSTGVLKGIATGLSTVSNVVVSIDSAGAPTNLTVSANPSPRVAGGIDIYVWQPTSASVTTPVAATVASIVRWHAWGTL